MTNPILTEFAAEAQRYVGWANGTSAESMDCETALRRILALYAAALQLPFRFRESTSTGDEGNKVGADEWKLIYERASSLPLKYYGEVFDPIPLPPEEPVVGDIADDIADIYRDVATGLRHYEMGRLEDALWEWRFNFWIHWGEHATGAIRVLHCHLSQNAETPANDV